MIPVFRPSYDHREEEAVATALRTGWVGLGPAVEEFERQFAAKVGARFAVGLNSCTSALHLALIQLGIGPGDEVIVPTVTFISTASVVEQLGARPVFCDVDESTLLLDWNDVHFRRTERTKAVIAVLYGGQPVFRPANFDLPVIYDCAHACGGNFDTSGNLCCWSFHAVKNLATGDGGMLTTDDEQIYRRANRLRWLGIDRTTWDRSKLERRYWWEYDIAEAGYKTHMNDITASIGLVQLQKLPSFQDRRRHLLARYRKHLEGVVELPPENRDSSWHLFVVRCDRRNDLAGFLRERGVSTGVHYKPLHLYDYFSPQPALPVAESAWRRILTLPLFPDLADGQIDEICDLVKQHERPI